MNEFLLPQKVDVKGKATASSESESRLNVPRFLNTSGGKEVGLNEGRFGRRSCGVEQAK
jgi:hypothetical protein